MPNREALLAVALALACSRAATDRAPPGPGERGLVASSQLEADPCPDSPPPALREPAPAATDERPPTVAGIVLEPTFAAQCELPQTPRVLFEFDSADLDGGDVEVLRRVAGCLTEGPLRGRSIELVGRTDPRGPPGHNEPLARARVEAVRDFLRDRGVPAANMAVRVAAEAFADPAWPPGWAHDRRVDIRLLR